MAKKSVKNKTIVKTIRQESTNKILIENFVQLQKIMTNLAEKFENLSDNITKLLQLFEISARSFAEKQATGEGIQKDKEFLDKLNNLTEQNKTIAKGLTLLEEKLRERVYGSTMEQSRPMRPRF